MRGLSLLSLLCLVWHASFALASQCNVFSSTSGHGKYLTNHVVQSIPNTSLQDCTNHCVSAGFCKSTNFDLASKTCELNNADQHDYPEDYNERLGSSYSGWSITQPIPKSCLEAKEKKQKAQSGYYLIQTKRGKRMTVYCDMDQHGGGWTLVVSVSSANWNHLQRDENNCVNPSLGLCVEYKTNAIPARKLSDQDIVDIMSEDEAFRIELHTGGPYSVFYKIPSGARNFDSSCSGQGPPICPRIIISHHYPYQWESNPCNNISVGYRIHHSRIHCVLVFDGHDDNECGSRWESSLISERRILYGHRHADHYGIYAKKQGLVFVK